MKFKAFVMTAAALALTANISIAAQTTTNLSVTALVADTCTVTANSALAFATLDTAAGSDEATPGSLTLLCTANKTGVTVTLDGGANAAAGQRKMANAGGNEVPYNIFSDSGHTNAVAEDGEIFNGNLTAITPVNVSVYGQTPPGSYTAGNYTDTVLVTMNYP